MKVLIATSTYPPETGRPAEYVSGLVNNFKAKHQVTTVAYTENHEGVGETRLVGISKRGSMPIRLFKFFYMTLRELRNADIAYCINALSAGFPTALACYFRNKPLVINFIGDETTGHQGSYRNSLQHFALTRASSIIVPTPLLRDFLVEKYKIDNKIISINYNPVDPEIVLPWSIVREPHTILLSIRNWKTDEISKLESVMTKLANEYPDLKTHFITKKISKAETWYLLKKSALLIMDGAVDKTTDLLSKAYACRTVVLDKSKTDIYKETQNLFNNQEVFERRLLEENKILEERFSWTSHLQSLEKNLDSILHKPPYKV